MLGIVENRNVYCEEFLAQRGFSLLRSCRESEYPTIMKCCELHQLHDNRNPSISALHIWGAEINKTHCCDFTHWAPGASHCYKLCILGLVVSDCWQAMHWWEASHCRELIIDRSFSLFRGVSLSGAFHCWEYFIVGRFLLSEAPLCLELFTVGRF